MLFEKGNTLATGRPKGTPNKVSTEIRDMVRQALDHAGGVSYLAQQAFENPTAFLTLIGKIIPNDVKISLVMPEARVYPQGVPEVIEQAVSVVENEQARLSTPSEAVDSVH